MINHTARREAEEFARVIDGPASADVADRYAGLTRTVTLLREHPQPVPRTEFVLDLRERLLAAAETELAPAPADPRENVRPIDTPRKGRRRLATVAAAAVIVGGSAGVAAAAQGSLPGDTLYPVKRGLESVQLHLTTSDSARGQDLLAQAGDRLQEAQALLAEPRTDRRNALVRSTLADATQNANNGAGLLFRTYQRSHSASDIVAIRQFAADQMSVLNDLADHGGKTFGQLNRVGDAIAAIDQQARVLCAACSDLPDAAVPGDVLNLSAASTTLTHLVTIPTKRAGQLEKLLNRAQQIAHHAPATTTKTHSESSSEISEDSGDTTSTTQSDEDDSDSNDTHPVNDLLTGLSNTTKNNLPGQVKTTVNGLTTDVKDLLDGTVKDVGSLLGGNQD